MNHAFDLRNPAIRRPKQLRWLRLTASVAALGLALAGCGSGNLVGNSSTVLFVTESEPNNLAAQANFFGFLGPSQTIVIQGSVAGVGGGGPDGADGFEFSSPGGVYVSFFLESADQNSDVDVCLFDPVSGTYVACWESPFANEAGEFWVDNFGADYQLVVLAANAATAYTLEVTANTFSIFYAESGSEGEVEGQARATQPQVSESLPSGPVEWMSVDQTSADLIAERGPAIVKPVTGQLAQIYAGSARPRASDPGVDAMHDVPAAIELDKNGRATLIPSTPQRSGSSR